MRRNLQRPGLLPRRQASAYFEAELKKGLDDLKTCAIRTESKEAATDINPLLQTLFDKIRFSNVFLKNIDLVTNQLLKSYFQLNY